MTVERECRRHPTRQHVVRCPNHRVPRNLQMPIHKPASLKHPGRGRRRPRSHGRRRNVSLVHEARTRGRQAHQSGNLPKQTQTQSFLPWATPLKESKAVHVLGLWCSTLCSSAPLRRLSTKHHSFVSQSFFAGCNRSCPLASRPSTPAVPGRRSTPRQLPVQPLQRK
jgi:hypothetical protein